MKKFAFVPLAALVALGACSEGPTSVSMDQAASPLFSNANEMNGPTRVIGGFQIAASGASVTFNNIHPQGMGSCRDASGIAGTNGPIWHNAGGQQQTGAKFCVAEVVGAATTCTLNAAATYAASAHTAGRFNENLNFDVTAAVGYDAVTNTNPDLWVKYRGQQNDTRGAGVLAFTASCDNGSSVDGTLSMAQFALKPGSLFSSSNGWGSLNTTGVSVAVDGNNYALSSLTWEYRSGL